jgi:hypothetical protein
MSNFLSDLVSGFLGNLFADILVSLVAGGLLAWWVGKRLNELQQSQQRKAEKRADITRALCYLEIIKNEVVLFRERLPDLANKSNQLLDGIGFTEKELHLPTPKWDIIEPSGELPRLLDPVLLSSLAEFYDYIKFAKRGVDRYLQISDPQISDKQSYQATLQYGFNGAIPLAFKLVNMLDAEIQSLNKQVHDKF